MNPLFPADTFIVINKSVLKDTDRKILSLLYQPIIGSNSINLYMTLWSYLDKYDITSYLLTHHDLMNSMQSSLDNIIESLQKLEAIGLIKCYLKKGDVNNYVYEIFSPVEAYTFFKDPILSTLLNNNIGNNEYKKIKKLFETPSYDLSNYIDVTCNFKDVFEITSIINDKVDNVKKTSSINIDFEPNIQINQVLSNIPNTLLDFRTISNETKENIYKLAFIYNYDNNMMSELIINSLDNKKINMELLKNKCRDYYRFDNDNRIPSLVYKNQPDYLKSKKTSINKLDLLVNLFDNMSPYEFLASKNKCKPTSIEMDIISYLLMDLKLQPGVVNVLIDYVLKINNNKLTKRYVETIAVQWKRNNIQTVLDAINLASKEYKKVPKSTKIKKEVPDWFNETITKEEVSLEEQEKLKQQLKDLIK